MPSHKSLLLEWASQSNAPAGCVVLADGFHPLKVHAYELTISNQALDLDGLSAT